jgi:hypothetical protein
LVDALANRLDAHTIMLACDQPFLLSERIEVTRDVTLVGHGDGVATLDGQGLHAVIKVDAAATVRLERIKITRGHLDSDAWSGSGVTNHGTLHMIDCTVSENTLGAPNLMTVMQGVAGVHNLGTLRMTNCAVVHNRAYDIGTAGVVNTCGFPCTDAAHLTIEASTITDNVCAEARGRWEARGAGLLSDGSLLNVSSSEIARNHATLSGGGIFVMRGSTYVSNTRVHNNSAYAFGGGIFVGGGTLYLGDRTTVENNRAEGCECETGSGCSCAPTDVGANLFLRGGAVRQPDPNLHAPDPAARAAETLILQGVLRASNARGPLAPLGRVRGVPRVVPRLRRRELA